MSERSSPPVTDEQLGKIIRELFTETGQGIYIPPRSDGQDDQVRIALFTNLPDEDDYYLVKECWLAESESVS